MIVTIGKEGLAKTWQEKFPETTICCDCGGEARIGFVAHELESDIVHAIKELSDNGWYGFRLGRNEHEVSKIDLFTPTDQDAGIVGEPPPQIFVDAANCMDWSTVPSDNIDGVPHNAREKEIRNTTPLERTDALPKATEHCVYDEHFNEEGSFWLHDRCAVAIYFCRKCCKLTALYNQG